MDEQQHAAIVAVVRREFEQLHTNLQAAYDAVCVDVEALTDERDELRAALDAVTAQRDGLRALLQEARTDVARAACGPPDLSLDPMWHCCDSLDLLERMDAVLSPPDALTGILANAVTAQAGRCLVCNQQPALYCGLDCASRGR